MPETLSDLNYYVQVTHPCCQTCSSSDVPEDGVLLCTRVYETVDPLGTCDYQEEG